MTCLGDVCNNQYGLPMANTDSVIQSKRQTCSKLSAERLHSKDGKTLHPELLNLNVQKAQYAVRGELYLRAEELRQQGKEIIFTNGEGHPPLLCRHVAISPSRMDGNTDWGSEKCVTGTSTGMAANMRRASGTTSQTEVPPLVCGSQGQDTVFSYRAWF
jgi:hypothetical protein